MKENKLEKYANSLILPKKNQAVSFSFLNKVGNIIYADRSEINTTHMNEKILPPTELIDFIL